MGVCAMDDLALSVLASVVGYNKDLNRLITDAGMIALSLDRSTARQKLDMGYGAVCDVITAAPIPGLIVESVNQEHGIITSREGAIDYSQFPIGSQVRILPNHACTMASAHDHYHVVEGDDEIVDTWDRIHGW